MKSKLLKSLCIGLIPCIINSSFVLSMEGNSDENKKIIREWNKDKEKIYGGSMSGGYLYTNEKYPNLIMKTIPDYGCDTFEKRASIALEGKHVSENLMYVDKVLDDKVFLFGRIYGKTLSELLYKSKEKLSLELDFFIEKWCIGLFNATEIFRQYTDEYKGDMASRNIMVEDTTMIPILIDFGDNWAGGKIGSLASILKEVMDKGFVKSDGQEKKWNELKKYLDEIEETKEFNIDKFRKIKEGVVVNK